MKHTRQPTARRSCSGQVLNGMKPDDDPLEGKKNDPMMPVAWVKTYTGEQGKTGTRFHDHHGRCNRPGKRRHCAGCWSTRLTGPSGWRTRSRRQSDVTLVGEYHPLPFGFGTFKKGTKPEDQAIR